MFGFDNKQVNDVDDNQPQAIAGAPPVNDVTPPDLPMTAPSPTLPAAPTHDDSMSSQDHPSEDLLPADHTKDDLSVIKQEALQNLSPLVGHLDQTPEEKFKTTMMMIQASDDSSLISTAYEAAKSISDEKARAQALLDIVNEINYFTQNQN